LVTLIGDSSDTEERNNRVRKKESGCCGRAPIERQKKGYCSEKERSIFRSSREPGRGKGLGRREKWGKSTLEP